MDGFAGKKSIGCEVSHLFIKIGIGERGEVLETRNIDIYFFLDFPLQGGFERFVPVREPPREVMISPFGRQAPPGQNDAAGRFDNPGDGRRRVVEINVVAIGASDCFLIENFNLPAATVRAKSEMGVLDQGIPHP